MVATNDRVAILIRDVACYLSGFHMALETVPRYVDDVGNEDYGDLFWRTRRGTDPSPQLLRVEIAYADGKRASTVDAVDPMSDLDNLYAGGPEQLRLQLGDGGGGGGSWSFSLWVTPLPPDGPVTFTCAWPALGVEPTDLTVQGSRFVEAARKARPIFEGVQDHGEGSTH